MKEYPVYCTLRADCPVELRCQKKFFHEWARYCLRTAPEPEVDPVPVAPPARPSEPEAAPEPPNLPPAILALNLPWAPGACVTFARDDKGRTAWYVPLATGQRFILRNVEAESGDR